MSAHHSITPPIVAELQAIFDSLPDAILLAKLRGPKRRGRPGFDPMIPWRCYVTYYALGVESVSALLRLVRDNPYIAQVCGIDSPAMMPSQPTMSRFISKLATRELAKEVREVQRGLTRRLYDTLPDFGRSVAIDSTDLKGWSNPNKRGKRGRGASKRQRPRIGKVSDSDAGWVVKGGTNGRKKYVWGYKAHILSDTRYELPLVIDTTAGNVGDIRKATPLLGQARKHYTFAPDYVICDAGYSSAKLRTVISRQYRALPIIDPHAMHPKSKERADSIENWKELFKRRSSIERINGRLKGFFKLNSLRVRGRMKVRVHAHMSVIALQARAVAFPENLRQCVRAA